METMEELFQGLNLNKFDANNLNLRFLCLFNKGKINKKNLKGFYDQLKEKFDNFRTGEITLLSTLLEAILSTQSFLVKKLKLKDGIGILENEYLDLWGNRDNDDFLDEMTVILQSNRKIALGKIVYIGESTFLQEYYQDNSIVSWSHYFSRNYEFWNNMDILLKKEYVNGIFEKFNLRKNILLQIQVNYAIENFDYMHCFVKYSERKIKKQQMQKNFCIEPVIPRNTFVVFETLDGRQEIYFQWNIIHKGHMVKTLPKRTHSKKK